MKTLFITGASGFIGRHLIEKINHKAFDSVFCLSRTGELPSLDLSSHPNIRVVKGDLFDAEAYAEFLASSDIVLHLAAVTGKAKPEEYFRVNAEGTEFLVRQCERVGIKNFLFVSTIATKFPDISSYFYAQSKKVAEAAVVKSSLKYTIVRPTIVIGKYGASWQSLAKLARKPVIGIFGDGKTKIQPILVDDLVDCILSAINEERFFNEAYDVGGPKVITLEDFLLLIYAKYGGKSPRTLHIPLNPLIPLLTVLEKIFPSLLPINVGQLSPFRFDSTVEQNSLFIRCQSKMKNNSEMLDFVVDAEKEDTHLDKLCKESILFTSYLLETTPNDYVLKKYVEGHRRCNLYPFGYVSAFDKILIKLARLNQFLLRMIDIYCRFFFKNGVIRKKLTLLLAILESCSPFNNYLDCVTPYGRIRLFAALLMKPMCFAFQLAVSVLVLGPLHIAFEKASKLRGFNQ